MRKSTRAALVASITRDVRYLVRQDRFRDLELTLDLTGYLSNFRTHTSKDLGNAIIALASVLPDDDLIKTAHGAAFYRASGGKGVAHADADAIADQVLRNAGIDVARWEARLERGAA